MKKTLLLSVLLVIACFFMTSCRVISSEDYEVENKTVSAEITGRCITGTDGKLIISGIGDNQQVYIINKNKSNERLVNTINEGDEVTLECEIITDIFPMNLIVNGGISYPSDKKICISSSLFSTLRDTYMTDDSLYNNSQTVLTSDYTGVCAVFDEKVMLLNSDAIIINGDCLKEVKNGDKVKVTLGDILETYPAQSTAYACEIIENDCMNQVSDDLIESLRQMGHNINK